MTTLLADTRTDVVVTGIGVVAPNGLGTRDYWAATLAGRGGIDRITRFDPSGYPATLGGEVPGFAAEEHIPNRLLPQTDQMTRLAIASADWALADARVDPAVLPEYGMGVVTSSAIGGFEFGQRELAALWGRGPEYVSVYQSFAWFYAVNTGQISIRHGMRGPSGVFVTEQAGGLDAIAQARRRIRAGTRLVVTGAVDSAFSPWGWTAQLANGLISTSDDPERAFLPFDAGANGYVPGEGGAILVLEQREAMRERGHDEVYGLIAGYGATFDPGPGSGGAPGLARAIRIALADARVLPSEVDVVFADAAGVPDLDRVEERAITEVLGERVAVTAPKTMTGRLNAGGSALDVVTALLSIRDGVIPPTTNVTRLAPGCPLRLVRRARSANLRTALVLARGHGGFNSAMVVRSARKERA